MKTKNLLLAVLVLVGPLTPAIAQDALLTPTSPLDVAIFATTGNHAWGFTKTYDLDACLERELHDGQFLAGGCKDLLFLLRQVSVVGQKDHYEKAAHLGVAFMSNAQHGNTSVQMKGGADLGTAGQALGNLVALVAPKAADWGTNLPPWVAKVGHIVTLDGFGGWRPVHDASVNGAWTYGVGAAVNVPVETVFAWLSAGL